MKKPNNYDATKTGGDYIPVDLGGHYMVLKAVEETQSKTGKDMLKIMFDFDIKDQQAGYFMDAFKADKREKKTWSNQATKYLLVNDKDGNTGKNFKSFITSVEKSNNITIKWGDEVSDWAGQFKDKKIGGIFGTELDFYNGEVKKKRVLRWFCSTDKVDGADIPDISETKAYKDAMRSTTSSDSNNDFMSVPDIDESELPWN